MSTESPNRLHCLASVNPFHNGHLALLRRGLEHADSIDITIGKKPKPHRLEPEIRAAALSIGLVSAGIQDRVQITQHGRKQVVPEEYSGILMGSSVLPTLVGLRPTQKTEEEIE